MTTQTNTRMCEVFSPLNGEHITSVPTVDDLDQKVINASQAAASWARTTIKNRSQVFFKYRELLHSHRDELMELIRNENGKTEGESMAEVDKAIEITEFACSLPQLATGDILEVSRGVFCEDHRVPMGVVACIAPFNFPVMVPHWTIPIALMLGNTMIFKPSEVVPLSMIRCAELLTEAGLPDKVFQLAHGQREMVEAICDHPGISTISFVGSTKVAQIVYKRASQSLKRVLALGGAKNHLIVLPDANPDMTAANVSASMTGCAGQRCMAASVLVAVGDVQHIIDAVVTESRSLCPGQNIGAVISVDAKLRIERAITQAETAGATVLLDGRNTIVKGAENGHYVGPTIIDNVTPDMAIAQEEIFGPVLSIIRCNTAEEAISIQNANPYGNGASIYTSSGSLARRFTNELTAGMLGVNIGVPVPREPFAFGGIKGSKFGVGDITGKSSIHFWTETRKVTTKWNASDWTDWMS